MLVTQDPKRTSIDQQELKVLCFYPPNGYK